MARNKKGPKINNKPEISKKEFNEKYQSAIAAGPRKDSMGRPSVMLTERDKAQSRGRRKSETRKMLAEY